MGKSKESRQQQRQQELLKLYQRQGRLPRPKLLKPKAVDRANRRAEKHKSKGYFTRADFEALRVAFKQRCYYCLKPSNTLHADHFIPISKQGDNDISNIVPACPKCNSRKSDMMPWEFKRGEGFSPKVPEQWTLDNFPGEMIH